MVSSLPNTDLNDGIGSLGVADVRIWILPHVGGRTGPPDRNGTNVYQLEGHCQIGHKVLYYQAICAFNNTSTYLRRHAAPCFSDGIVQMWPIAVQVIIATYQS